MPFELVTPETLKRDRKGWRAALEEIAAQIFNSAYDGQKPSEGANAAQCVTAGETAANKSTDTQAN